MMIVVARRTSNLVMINNGYIRILYIRAHGIIFKILAALSLQRTFLYFSLTSSAPSVMIAFKNDQFCLTYVGNTTFRHRPYSFNNPPGCTIILIIPKYHAIHHSLLIP